MGAVNDSTPAGAGTTANPTTLSNFRLEDLSLWRSWRSTLTRLEGEMKDCVEVIDAAELNKHLRIGKDVAAKLCIGWMGGVIIRKVSLPLIMLTGTGLVGAHYLAHKQVIGVDYQQALERLRPACKVLTEKVQTKDWSAAEVLGGASLALGLFWGIRRR